MNPLVRYTLKRVALLPVMLLLLATYAILWRLDRSWFGRACRAVREELPVKEAILDGEVVALDGQGRQNIEALPPARSMSCSGWDQHSVYPWARCS